MYHQISSMKNVNLMLAGIGMTVYHLHKEETVRLQISKNDGNKELLVLFLQNYSYSLKMWL